MDDIKRTFHKTVYFTPGICRVLIKCSNCGIEFYKNKSYVNSFNTCSKECDSEFRSKFKGESSPSWKGGGIKGKCIICGKDIVTKRCEVKKGWGKYCSAKCRSIAFGKLYSGKNNPNYKIGRSFKKYCDLFGENLKSRVRDFWGNKCVICGANKSKDGTELHVHHVDGNKSACCDGNKPRFVILCKSCHSTVGNKARYGKGEYHENMFNKMIDDRNGKSFFSCEEHKEYLLNLGGK